MTMRTMTKITNTDTNVSRAFSSRRSRRESNEGRPPSTALVRPSVLLIGVLSTYLKRRWSRVKTAAAPLNRTAKLPCGGMVLPSETRKYNMRAVDPKRAR